MPPLLIRVGEEHHEVENDNTWMQNEVFVSGTVFSYQLELFFQLRNA